MRLKWNNTLTLQMLNSFIKIYAHEYNPADLSILSNINLFFKLRVWICRSFLGWFGPAKLSIYIFFRSRFYYNETLMYVYSLSSSSVSLLSVLKNYAHDLIVFQKDFARWSLSVGTEITEDIHNYILESACRQLWDLPCSRIKMLFLRTLCVCGGLTKMQ